MKLREHNTQHTKMSKAMRAVGEDVWKTKVDKVVSRRSERYHDTAKQRRYRFRPRHKQENRCDCGDVDCVVQRDRLDGRRAMGGVLRWCCERTVERASLEWL